MEDIIKKIREGTDAVVFRTQKNSEELHFLNQIILYQYSLYPYEFDTAVKNLRTAENRRWHFEPSQLYINIICWMHFQKKFMWGALTLRGTPYPLHNLK